MSMSIDRCNDKDRVALLEATPPEQPGRYRMTLTPGPLAERRPTPKPGLAIGVTPTPGAAGAARTGPAPTPGAAGAATRLTPTPGAAGAATAGPKRAALTSSNLVYALGQIRCDRGGEDGEGVALPGDADGLWRRLDADPGCAADLTWTLEQGGRPLYVLRPGGAQAAQGYERLRAMVRAQAEGRLVCASVPAVVTGRVVLAEGRLLPVLEPEPLGLYAWLAAPAREAGGGGRSPSREEPAGGELGFQMQGRDELHNAGVTARERAINYAATDAFHTGTVYAAALHRGMRLEAVEASAASACRPGADCWNVTLSFARPAPSAARMVYRFVVDVGDALPVTVGKVRSWGLC